MQSRSVSRDWWPPLWVIVPSLEVIVHVHALLITIFTKHTGKIVVLATEQRNLAVHHLRAVVRSLVRFQSVFMREFFVASRTFHLFSGACHRGKVIGKVVTTTREGVVVHLIDCMCQARPAVRGAPLNLLLLWLITNVNHHMVKSNRKSGKLARALHFNVMNMKWLLCWYACRSAVD